MYRAGVSILALSWFTAREESPVHYKDHGEKTRVASGRVADLHVFANRKSDKDFFLPGSVRNVLLEPSVDFADAGHGLVALSPHCGFQPPGYSRSDGMVFQRRLEITSYSTREHLHQPIKPLACLFAPFAATSPYDGRGGS